MKILHPAIFLDRDGVLIENRSNYVRNWSQVSIFSDTSAALSKLHNMGYKLIIVTNQSAVGRGLMSLKTAGELNRRLVEYLNRDGGHVDAVYMCPHRPEDDCECRKPKPGLILQAAQELTLDLQRSWLVGDAWSDLQAGQAAHIRNRILVKTGRGNGQLLQTRPAGLDAYLLADDLTAAVDIILSTYPNQI